MANLRGLLGKEFGSTIDDTAATFGSYTKVRDGMVFNFMPYCNMGNCDNNYRGYYIQHWCVPCGTTQITVELWGGGGSGAGACCCQQGIPGGSGSYVRKTLQYPQIQGGWCYYLCVAPPTCCASCCCGIQGCKSFIVGCNVSNLCADGGLPGKTCCYAYWSNDFRCTDRHYFAGSGGWTPGTDGASSYGGDEMIKGGPGFFRTYNTSSTCWSKISYPLDLSTTKVVTSSLTFLEMLVTKKEHIVLVLLLGHTTPTVTVVLVCLVLALLLLHLVVQLLLWA